ncbi:hypothetical protein PHIM7_242 [Sinorhizobium phage phiM7]|uniref:Uncharacterized protein n=2 Tax=Emdodecavirus TaxID=1980937 RepID=A0A068NZ99_9CAUD|nr:hypothetical protein AB690_gp265 [Sinorhizobium phage phiM12]YP_009601367.1 hypothetical protein FDH46_gp236 [Sinorhizobium phage phiM7]AIF27786.1 hypothetical protein SmphiM12_325 [Sinorhizobium phage phiM12]AKF12787.1 hypothetical protein PHIM7_242 [Sinorhizobium phage phiM7]AKF13148.1 hypothetical protein PHIM19_243 [Sinorhizobium phage phiM19]
MNTSLLNYISFQTHDYKQHKFAVPFYFFLTKFNSSSVSN